MATQQTPTQLSRTLSSREIDLLREVESNPLRFRPSARFESLRRHNLITRGELCGFEITGRGQAVLEAWDTAPDDFLEGFLPAV